VVAGDLVLVVTYVMIKCPMITASKREVDEFYVF